MTDGPDVGEVRSQRRVDEGLVRSLAVPGLVADLAGKGGQASRSSSCHDPIIIHKSVFRQLSAGGLTAYCVVKKQKTRSKPNEWLEPGSRGETRKTWWTCCSEFRNWIARPTHAL